MPRPRLYQLPDLDAFKIGQTAIIPWRDLLTEEGARHYGSPTFQTPHDARALKNTAARFSIANAVRVTASKLAPKRFSVCWGDQHGNTSPRGHETVVIKRII